MSLRPLALTIMLVTASMCDAQTVDLNRAYRFHTRQRSIDEGDRLVVRYKGMNTSNGAWVRDLANDSTLAAGVCTARERLTLVVDRMPPGTYEVGFAGCWSGYALELRVRPRRER